MNREHSSIVSPVKKDDAYWSALFLQEELLESSPPHILEENWPTNNHIPNPGSNNCESSNTWQLAHDVMTSDRTLRLQVTGYNKGGLLVSWYDLQGFVPASQLVDFPLLHVARERLRVLSSLEGKTLTLKIMEVDPGKNRLVLSERSAQVKASQRVDTLNRIRNGNTIRGLVTNLTDFGAFVDLGGVEGLIHISELSWSRVTHPSSILQSGQEVRVLVLNVDHERERVALSYKRLKEDPWQTAAERYKPDDIVTGIVSNVTSFGAFVLLEEELEGLVHITELAEGSFLHPLNVVQQGDKVAARVLQVDGQKKRLALTLRGLQNP
jgi:small subunit ribosomal protein S1